jgi:putative MATE family efflux protein
MSLNNEFTYKRIWQIAWPVMIGSIAQNLINVIDTAFLAHLNETALGAAAIGGLFYLTLAMVGAGLGIGSQIIMSRRFGERNFQAIGSTFRLSIVIGALFALSCVILYFLFGKPMLSLLLHSQSVVDAASEFLNYRIFGLFFAFINYQYNAFFVSITRTRAISYATLITAVVNIVLDYLLIFGNFGCPKMGISGAALASVIAEIASVLFFTWYATNPVNIVKYRIWKKNKLNWSQAVAMLKISVPLMLQNMVSFSSWFIFFILIERMGERSLAVSNVMRSLYMILLLPTWGFAQAASSQVSYAIGKGLTDKVLLIARKIAWITFLSVLPLIFLTGIFASFIFRFYTDDVALIHDCMPLLPVILGATLLLAPAFIFFSSVSGTGNTQITFRNEMVVITCYLLFTFLIVRIPGISTPVVWLAEVVYSTTMGSLSFLYLRYGKWRNKKV